MRWCLYRSQQSKNTASTKRMANLSNIVRVLEEEYLNSFGATLDESWLYNLSSGKALSVEIADDITKCFEGLELMQISTGRLLENGEQKFYDLIARNQIKHLNTMFVRK